ncbi:MAG: phage replisome organizer N-terminal domain-containing protein [Fusobacterium sp.]|uniref:phage replisome organizer N-terminal domain-containing protein n=1 Tax=Fusobacterium sp. TaxID=68766 RepID=UPI0026DB9EFA|nr:phage replisome organizer N-terminal domain-containing protein [Fusobacterium sp.]MDO4690435.1 phage replisome organizer N-terminal domain-containing protein [Fusobacterium sp.]
MAKRYYWLKLKEDFFESEEIKIIESTPNGVIYSNFYLKLLCKSLKTEGKLIFKDTIPYSPEMLASLTGVPIDTVRVALDMFIQLGLMDKLDTGALYMKAIESMTGSETIWADKKRKQRELEKQEKALLENKVSDERGQSLDNVPKMSGQKKTLSDKSIEYRDKNIDKDHDNNNLNNINIIKELFENFGINFSKKHSDFVSELLKKNSVDFLVSHFTRQYEILKANPAVKNIAAVFSKHLFEGTCEVDNAAIVEREKTIENLKKEEIEEENNQARTLDIFYSLSYEKQIEVEQKLLDKSQNPEYLLKTKKETPFLYYQMISKELRKIMISEKLIL